MNSRLRQLGLTLVLLLAALLGYATYLQAFAAPDLLAVPENPRGLLAEVEAPRGLILSADGEVLAESEKTDRGYRRRYPQGELTGHLTGYSGLHFGRAGLEQTYSLELSPTPAGGLVERAFATVTSQESTARDLVLTLDLDLQRTAAEALGRQKGAVVAIDPKTGAVRAMVSYPRFDPEPLASLDRTQARSAWDRLSGDADKPLLNRAAQEVYPPGSTFKIVSASAALDSGLLTPESTFVDRGEIALPFTSHRVRNFGGAVHGEISLARALIVSSNVVFAEVGLRLGAGRLVRYAEAFGLNERPPYDLPAAESVVPPADQLDEPSTAMSAIGQRDVRVTPLEMSLIASAIANAGHVPTPHIVQEVRSQSGAVVEKINPRPWRRAVTEETAATMTGLLVDVVERGTGRRAQISGVRLAGKTGTAQTGSGAPHAWFVAFAPAENPRIAVAVLVERGGQEERQAATGGRLAAPIARQVIVRALQELE